MELIKSWVYNPKESFFKSKSNQRACVYYKYCSNPKNCSAYKQKKCVLLNSKGFFGYMSCPYGESQEEEGYTKRADKFYHWITEKEKDTIGQDIKSTGKGIFEIGEYYLLNYSFINCINSIFENEEEEKFFKKYNMIKKEKFNKNFIENIINKKAKNIHGNEIKDWQEKEVPLLIENLKKNLSKIYNELSKEIKNKYVINNIGRKAYKNTLKTGCSVKDCHNNNFRWDGEYFICENYKLSFNFCEGNSILKTKPTENELIEIKNENQIDENTKFKD